MLELILTIKIPNRENQALRLLNDAYIAIYPNSSGIMNSNNPLSNNSSPISCMVWNVQGAGSREFLKVLRELIRLHKPTILILVETHMGGNHAQKLANLLKFNGHVRVDAQGFSGGIWVYWKPKVVTVDAIEQNHQYITMEVTRVGETPWYFSAIYASPNPTNRKTLWEALTNFANTHNKPWLLAGDFNETRFDWERSVSCAETSRRSERFNNWIECTHLIEVEFSGPSHTWSRGNSIETRRSARLDRMLCNIEWGLQFDQAYVKHLPALPSDHCPLLLSCNGFTPLGSLNKPFRFQAAWLTHEHFSDFIKSQWNTNTPPPLFLSCIKSQKNCKLGIRWFFTIYFKRNALLWLA